MMSSNQIIITIFAVIIQRISGQCAGSPFGANVFNNNLAAVESPAFANNGLINNAIAYGGPLTANELYGPGLPLGLSNFGSLGISEVRASSGGGFTVTSSSPIAPHGISVLSDNLIMEGPVAVNGQLPFLSTVGFEGPLPATGQGAVTYGCGNGNVGIVAEGPAGSYMPNGMSYSGMSGAFGPDMGLNNFGAPFANGVGVHGVAY